MRPIIAFAALALFATAAVAQRDPLAPTGHNGAFVSATEDSVVLKLKDGTLETVAMTSQWTVSVVRAATLEAIHRGDFVASINADIDANTGRANEVRIFEPGYQPELGTHAVGQAGNSITHGTVAEVQPDPVGIKLLVTYPGGERLIVVPTATKITISDPRPRTILTAGTMVSALTRRGKDGTPRAGRLVLMAAN